MEDVNTSAAATPVDAVKALMLLRAELVQREARMSAAIGDQVQSLRQEVAQFRRDIAAIVDGAGNRIALDAKEAVSPVATEYGRAVSVASAQLRNAGRTVWVWLGTAGAILLMVLLVGWALLGYYRRELTTTKEELQRYEDAVPVVQAFYASDAVICGGVICINGDPSGARAGDKGQYRAAKPRQRP
ncbi:hypothetical protein [Pseudoxanthomonas sp. PXM01]|uniref:hypothetical protein n=1 Tax=Pseudoxanthomonas sp. PXM01 TaxID=2769295 RepID=UPI001CE13330|nr:hypothetical protein [Pseudoxanthomonas sp. PXM01]